MWRWLDRFLIVRERLFPYFVKFYTFHVRRIRVSTVGTNFCDWMMLLSWRGVVSEGESIFAWRLPSMTRASGIRYRTPQCRRWSVDFYFIFRWGWCRVGSSSSHLPNLWGSLRRRFWGSREESLGSITRRGRWCSPSTIQL